MNDQLIRDIDYNTTHALAEFDKIKDLKTKLYDIPMQPFTVEEAYRLREALLSIQVHVEMTRNDLMWHKRITEKKPLIKKLLRK